MDKETKTLKVIIADTDLKTFEELKTLCDQYNTVFLSSDFAVNFILEYEKIDTVIISNKISNLNSIIERTDKKRIKVFIMGRDTKYPVSIEEVEKILKTEQERKINEIEGEIPFFKKTFNQILAGKKRILENRKSNMSSHKDRISSIDTGNIKSIEDEKIINEKEINEFQELNKNSDITRLKIESLEKKTVKPVIENDYFKKSEPNDSESKRSSNKKMKIIKQKVIVLAKAKGGVGSTTIGLFLSSILKEFSILLVDLNFSEGGGDISYYLNIPKTPNIQNFLEGYSRESLDSSVIKFKENLDILQSPPTFDQSKIIELQDIYCLLDIAKKKYHIIIIDLPNQLGDMWLGAIDLADLLILVSDHSIGSIGRLLKINNKYLYKGLEKLLIFNMYDRQNGFDLLDSHINSFFDLKDYVVLKENNSLRRKTDFSDLDFGNEQNYFNLTNKVMELLAN